MEKTYKREEYTIKDIWGSLHAYQVDAREIARVYEYALEDSTTFLQASGISSQWDAEGTGPGQPEYYDLMDTFGWLQMNIELLQERLKELADCTMQPDVDYYVWGEREDGTLDLIGKKWDEDD